MFSVMERTSESIRTEKNGQPSYVALNAVADAMMAAQIAWLSPYLILPHKPSRPKEIIGETDQLLAEESAGGCAIGSLIAVDFLARRYPDLFSHIFVLVSINNPKNPFKSPDNFVAYFVAIDRDGYWHAGSTGNDNKRKATNPLISPIPPSQNEKDILNAIKKRERGNWTQQKFLRDTLFNDIIYEHPQRSTNRIIDGKKIGPGEVAQRVFTVIHQKTGNDEAYMQEVPTLDIEAMQNLAIALDQRWFERE